MEDEGKQQEKRSLLSLSIRSDFFQRHYALHGRAFPWREEGTDPFGILVAEILLKQTRAGKVDKVWPSLLVRYPSAEAMAGADPKELYSSVSELGFGNQRTKALIALSSAIKNIGEALPTAPEELIKLPYVGVYTAHAVACFAFGQRLPIVDLSVVRTISRIAGIQPAKDIRRAAQVWDFAWALLPLHRYQEHNYGLLDFIAAVCKPRSPDCNICPISSECAYGKKVRENWHQRDDRL